jgi:hypothetical protein
LHDALTVDRPFPTGTTVFASCRAAAPRAAVGIETNDGALTPARPRGAQIEGEVKAVGNLLRLRYTAASAVGV